MLYIRRSIWCTLLSLGYISLVVGAEVDVSKSPSSKSVIDATSQTFSWFSPELGFLIGIVMLALVVVARKRNAP